ncbi:hypothetical protein [uncultured Bacteroides sp.]|uniref:hypothetical protein n=1 Tax=uncultured Bacteroides sp. TaxID=162156 RepID=UPI002593AE67|nr:hypothetical protein [uncultured Bacteroides sp.]
MKKVLSLLLAVIMLLSLTIPAFAAEIDNSPFPDYNEETERQIDLLIQELVKLRLRSSDPQNSIAPAANINSEEHIFNSLRRLGAKVVGQDNLSDAESGIAAQAASSTFFEGFNTRYNDFIVTGPLRRRHGRSGYHVVTVRVVPKGSGSILGDSTITNVSLYSSKKALTSFAYNTISIYTQKAIGLIPIVQWLPYEYLFSGWSDADVNNTQASYVINVNSATTAKYVYIADTDVENESSYSLSLLDHSVTYHEVHNSSYTKNGVPGSKVTIKDYTIEGDYYDAPDGQAYQNFLIRYYDKRTAPSAKYYEKNSQGKDVLKHTVPAKSGLTTPYKY